MNGDNLYVEAFATNAVLPIVQHYHDRVKCYELWNEPNDWTSNPSGGVYNGGTFIYPSNFGWLLARSWEAVHITQQINDVTLFSGGVFGHNIDGVTNYANAGAQYIDDTYAKGTNLVLGGSFAYTKSNYNAYPLDGVGEHLYLSQGGVVSSNTFRQYEDWVHQALTKYEGANTPKKTFITEFGWQTTNSINTNDVSQAVQDTNLVTAFSAIDATPYVQGAIWFQWADNPAGSLWYGVLDSSGNPKLSYPDYQRFERFEGMYADATTNTAIQSYFYGLGQAALGCPYDNGHTAWVYTNVVGDAQDYAGGSHSNLTVLASTNGTFEVNDLHGFWSYYSTNDGPVRCGYATTNAYAFDSGTRQDFSRGYLTWDTINQVVWHVGNLVTAPPTGLQAVALNAEVALQWTAVPAATSYDVKRSTTNGGPYAILATEVGQPAFADVGASNNTTYYYVVSAVNSYGESDNSVPANATPDVNMSNLPSPWQKDDIGDLALTGGAGYSSGRFTLKGAGAGVGSTNDAFYFTSQPFSGDGAIIARVYWQQDTDPWAQAGVMFRETLDADSACAMALLTPVNGSHLLARVATAGSSSDVAGPVVAAPWWVRMMRSGNTFTASVSSDGVNFVQIGTADIPMANSVFVGFAVSSHVTNALGTAMFDNVSLVTPPLITSQPQSQTVNQGAAAAFAVTASSTAPLSYQWQHDGANVSGATASAFSLASAQPADAGNYTVLVSNIGGDIASSNAVLSVRAILAIDPAGVISWSGAYVLQSATNVAGPYFDVPGATSPYTNSSSGLPSEFFRLRN